MGRTTNCLALIRFPARLRERETPGIATNTTLALSPSPSRLEMQQAMLRIWSHLCTARGLGLPAQAPHSALRVGFWYENTPQHTAAQHGTAHRSTVDRITVPHHQRLRGLLLVYVCCCLCPLRLRLLATVDRKPPSYSYIL